jgi:hypothetical protein
MPRQCQACQSEYLQPLNQRIRNGDRLADLSVEYNLSEDVLFRHKRHLNAAVSTIGTLAEKWDAIYTKADELFRSANLLGDPRAAVEALSAAMRALENGTKAQDARQESGFESWPIAQQAKWVMANRELFRFIMDSIITEGRKVHGNSDTPKEADKPN